MDLLRLFGEVKLDIPEKKPKQNIAAKRPKTRSIERVTFLSGTTLRIAREVETRFSLQLMIDFIKSTLYKENPQFCGKSVIKILNTAQVRTVQCDETTLRIQFYDGYVIKAVFFPDSQRYGVHVLKGTKPLTYVRFDEKNRDEYLAAIAEIEPENSNQEIL